MRLIHAEGIIASEVTAFIPRVQGEETNPTFEHPEDWDSLSLQEKAHLILADKAVKLMGLLCRGNATRQQESEIITNQGSEILDREPRILGGEANMEILPEKTTLLLVKPRKHSHVRVSPT